MYPVTPKHSDILVDKVIASDKDAPYMLKIEGLDSLRNHDLVIISGFDGTIYRHKESEKVKE